jgi:hypothetical protein
MWNVNVNVLPIPIAIANSFLTSTLSNGDRPQNGRCEPLVSANRPQLVAGAAPVQV